jgi:hypothetical protein
LSETRRGRACHAASETCSSLALLPERGDMSILYTKLGYITVFIIIIKYNTSKLPVRVSRIVWSVPRRSGRSRRGTLNYFTLHFLLPGASLTLRVLIRCALLLPHPSQTVSRPCWTRHSNMHHFRGFSALDFKEDNIDYYMFGIKSKIHIAYPLPREQSM